MAYGNFVSITDFDIAPYAIPNLGESQEQFDLYVADQQEDVLRQLLGNALYDAFKDGLDVDTDSDDSGTPLVDESEDDVEQRWLYLKNGATYTYNERTCKWYGMKKALIPLIYAKWIRDNADSLSDFGVVTANIENSEEVSPAARISRAYNKFGDLVGRPPYAERNTLYDFLLQSGNTYTDSMDGLTLNQYLDENFADYGTMNQFGI